MAGLTEEEERAIDHEIEDADRLRPLMPEPHYPLPWRVAEGSPPRVIVVCANGNYVAECPTNEAAALIVRAARSYRESLVDKDL